MDREQTTAEVNDRLTAVTEDHTLLAGTALEEDAAVEPKLRPQTLGEYIGQDKVRDNLAVFLAAARGRGEPLDHVLLTGPPGLGKTTLAHIVAREMGAGLRLTSGPMIARAGDLAGILTNLQPKDVLFVDEIHRLNPAVEEILYPAMEDFRLDVMIGEGPMARTMKIDLPPFTLVGATTRPGLLSQPLHGRFGITLRLDFYDIAALAKIVDRSARILSIQITPEAAREIGGRARGTPRIANRLLRRLRDFAEVAGRDTIDLETARRPSSAWRWTSTDSTSSTGGSCPRSSRSSVAARSASARSPPPSAKTAAPSRISTSRICCRRGSCSARPAAAWPRRRPTAISESSRPSGMGSSFRASP